MELHQYLKGIRERWRSGLLAAVLVLALVGGFTALQSPHYQATNRIFVQARAGDGVIDLNSGVSYASQQISSYADLATTPLVLDQVIDDLELTMSPAALAEDIDVTVPAETLILEITAASEDPEEAAAIANSTAAHLEEQVATLAADGLRASIELRVVSPAVVPTTPSSPDIVRNAALGTVLALLAGITTALARSLLNTRIRGVDDLPSGPGSTVLATIPAVRGAEEASRVLVDSPYGPAAESYRELRTNLQFMKLVDGRRSILVTSSLKGEGKSTCAVNLAYAIARSGVRVLLVDADLRCPSTHTILGLEGSAGLSTVLIGQAELQDVVQPVGTDELDVLTSGVIPPNPSELLGSSAMEELLREASRGYDVVIVDTAPLLAVTDAAVLSQLVGGVVMVAQADRVRGSDLDRSMAKLETVGAKVVGVVLNRVRGLAGSRDAYAYAYAHTARQERAEPVGGGVPTTSETVDQDDAPEPAPWPLVLDEAGDSRDDRDREDLTTTLSGSHGGARA